MEQSILNTIENLKNYTDSTLKNIQKAKVPSIYKLNLEQRFSFEPKGVYNSIYQENCLLYTVNNLPYVTDSKPDDINMTLLDAVNDGIVAPFLLFVDNKFIKWSEIRIIADTRISYIYIDNIVQNTAQIQCILLPLYIIYRENHLGSNITSKGYFIFDSNDLLVNNINQTGLYTTITFINTDNNTFYESYNVIANSKYKSTLDRKYKLTENNIFTFKNGLLYRGDVTFYGLNIFSTDTNCLVKTFFYKRTNESLDNIQNIKNKDYLSNKILTDQNQSNYINELNIPFDFKFDNSKEYDQNIAEALEYIMKYNSSYMDNIYKQLSDIISIEYTGQYINSIKDNKGLVRMSRKIKDSIENFVIIFVNGELYKYYHELQYINKDFIFPCIDISNSDNIEILYFINKDNRAYELYLDSDKDNIFYINNIMTPDNISGFSRDLKSSIYPISRTNDIFFNIDCNFTLIDKDHIKIEPNDIFYYDKSIIISSNKQFTYLFKLISEDTINIKLTPDFLFCNNPDNYLIFVNGRKIDRENYKITIPSNTRPFDDMSIFMNIPLHQNDRVDIFYIGQDFEEIILSPQIPLSGDITIDKAKLGYSLNKYIYLLFINGKKVKIDDIVNIDNTRLRIINDQKSVKNLCVLKYIKDIDTLKSIFINESDLLTDIINNISSQELSSLYNQNTTLQNTDIDIQTNKIPMKNTIYEMINKYWLRPSIYDGNVFIYDFEDDQLLDKDGEGNILFNMMPDDEN